MAFPEPQRQAAANIFIVRGQGQDADFEPHRLNMVVRTRRWGDDDRLYDTNSDGIPDFPERAKMRYARERRRHVVSRTTPVAQPSQSLNEHAQVDLQQVPGRRIWAGIGGFLFIPSFPQLRRKETLWPDAT